MVYEPRADIRAPGEAIETAIPRIISFLRSQIAIAGPSILAAHEPESQVGKGYADLNHTIGNAITSYMDEVRLQQFPGKEHGYAMKEMVLAELQAHVD